MPDLYQQIHEYVAALKEQYEAARSDGTLTAAETFRLVQEAIRRLVEAAAVLTTLTGAEKKAAVMAGVEKLYDVYLAPLDMPGPDIVIDPLVRKVLLLAFDGLIEVFYGDLPDDLK